MPPSKASPGKPKEGDYHNSEEQDMSTEDREAWSQYQAGVKGAHLGQRKAMVPDGSHEGPARCRSNTGAGDTYSQASAMTFPPQTLEMEPSTQAPADMPKMWFMVRQRELDS